jgi:sulfotransferase
MVGGLRMPMGFPPAALESVPRLVPEDDDVFVVSYPKSGTTWLQYIVWLLVRQRPLRSDERLTVCFPHLEEVGAEAIGSLPRPRLIKTHLRRDMTPFSAAARYLVIVRNPFDTVVSFFHHTRGFPRHYDFADGTFAEFFECFIAGEVDFGDYFDHLASWGAEAARGNVLLLTYEGLSLDPGPEIRRIAAFLGEEASAGVATDAALGAVIDEASLGSMRRDQQRWSSVRPDWAPAFVREGKVGRWQSLITPSQARLLLAKFDRRLGGDIGPGLWPDVLADARAFAESDSPRQD